MNYASAKGMPRNYAPVRIISKVRHGRDHGIRQLIRLKNEDYVFIPERPWRNLKGEVIHVVPAVRRSRPVYKEISHAKD